MQAINAETGALITGTLESINGRAEIASHSFRLDGDGRLRFEHAGETEMFWESSETAEDARGGTLFIDAKGNDVPEHNVRLADDCPDCDGEGYVHVETDTYPRPFTKQCGRCNGAGAVAVSGRQPAVPPPTVPHCATVPGETLRALRAALDAASGGGTAGAVTAAALALLASATRENGGGLIPPELWPRMQPAAAPPARHLSVTFGPANAGSPEAGYVLTVTGNRGEKLLRTSKHPVSGEDLTTPEACHEVAGMYLRNH